MRDCESERVRSGSQLLSDIPTFFILQICSELMTFCSKYTLDDIEDGKEVADYRTETHVRRMMSERE